MNRTYDGDQLQLSDNGDIAGTPLIIMEDRPNKRFRYASYTQQIKNIHVADGKGKGVAWDADADDDEDTATPFTNELDRLLLLDLTTPFQDFVRRIRPLTPNLPVTLHNVAVIGTTFDEYYASITPGKDHTHSGLDSVLLLHQALFATCGAEALELIPSAVSQLLRIGAIPALEPKQVERTYSALSLVLRDLAGALLKPDGLANTTLRQTWMEVTPYLSVNSNKPYVRRCAIDAWVGVIRKARGDDLSRLLKLLLEQESQEGLEVMWAEAMQGTSNNLHSRALPLLNHLLDRYVSASEETSGPDLGKVLTALVHHCSASNLVPVVDSVLSRISTSSSATTKSNLKPSTKIIALLCVLMSVRKGKRFPESHKKAAMLRLVEVAKWMQSESSGDDGLEEMRRVLAQATVASLMCGQLALWLSPGVKLLDTLWQVLTTDEQFSFISVLLEQQWGGVEQFLAQKIRSLIITQYDSYPLATLTLLINLDEAGLLIKSSSMTQDRFWFQKVVNRIVARIETLEQGLPQTDSETSILQLSYRSLGAFGTLDTGVVNKLINTVSVLLAAVRSRSSKHGSGLQTLSHLVADSLSCIERLSLDDTAQSHLRQVLLEGESLADLFAHFNREKAVLDVVSRFVTRWKDSFSLEDDVIGSLEPNLLSASSTLRLSALRIFAAQATSQNEKDLWKLSIEVESADMTLRNVRERTTNIKRLGRHIQSVSTGDAAVSGTTLRRALMYLVSQLKVNFRPLYAATVAALSELVATCGEPTWSIVWPELSSIDSSAPSVPDLGASETERSDSTAATGRRPDVEGSEELDASLKCNSLNRSREIFGKSWHGFHSGFVTQSILHTEPDNDRLDVVNYETQLLALLRAVPQLAEKHTRILVPHALSILEDHANRPTNTLDQNLSTRKRHDRAAAYLDMFTQFSNPKAAYRTEDLRNAYLRFLQTGEPRLQGLALSCLMTFKSPNLLPYEEQLRSLLDEHKFRDALLKLPLGQNSESINPVHRSEIVPVAIRMLYGIVTSKRGRSSTVRNLKARRQAVLTAVSGCSSDELGELINLMSESANVEPKDGESPNRSRQQVGFLSLLSDVIRVLAVQIIPHWPHLIDSVLSMIEGAQKHLNPAEVGPEDGEPEDQDEDEEAAIPEAGMWRAIRTAGVKRIVQLFQSPIDFDWQPYTARIYASIISPRLDKLDLENSQAPSATLELIAAVAASTEWATLNTLDSRTLPKTFACLNSVKVKQPVILRVLDIVDSLLDQDQDSMETDGDSSRVLPAHIDTLIGCIIELVSTVKASKNNQLLPRLLVTVSRLSSMVTTGSQAQRLASLLGPFLRQKGRLISEKSKADILKTLQNLYKMSSDFTKPSTDFFGQQWALVANLFQVLFQSTSRKVLVDTIQVFSSFDPALTTCTTWITELNAYSAKRVDEPNFDRRLATYGHINNADLDDLPRTMREWLPLLRSSLFYIRDVEELSIRTSASQILRRYLDVAGSVPAGDVTDGVTTVLLPGLREALRLKSEAVRNEVLLVISHAVTTCPSISVLAEMKPLITEDEQTNFFVNIAHIQVHRRARALRRLREVMQANTVAENTISNILLPVAEHIVAGSTDVTDHHLVNEAIATIGFLAGKLRWSRYYGLLLRYLRLGSSQSAQQKLFIRTVTSIIDHFNFDVSKEVDTVVNSGEQNDHDIEDVAAEDEEDDTADKDGGVNQVIQNAIVSRLLPALTRFIESRKENPEAIRIPTAFAAVKLSSHLPEDMAAVEIQRIITTVAQALRSKDQDTRDTARETICRVVIFLGPTWLERTLKELQTALQRGPQKHVAAVTTHSILSKATVEASQQFEDLDQAVEDAVKISTEVIWGQSGSDAASEDFKTKMREVKSANSRAFDTLQLLARLVSPAKLSVIMAPIREILQVTQAVQPLLHVDEALRRISLGINSNTRISPADILQLCHALASGKSAYTQSKRKGPETSQTDEQYRVRMKRNDKADEDYFAVNSHKLVAFGLDLFVTAYRRGKIDFDDQQILSRLGPLVPIIGNSLYSKSSDVVTVGLKATAAIARCPITKVDEALPVLIKNIFTIIKQAGGTAESEVVQTALKSLAVILRECKQAKLSDSQLRYLIDIVKPDIEEHDRQSAIFTILRAIISRTFVVAEIYDLMDKISGIMITSQSTHVQELCRLTLMQFLLDYPQGKGRLKNQMTFLAQNLNYEFESGRMSIMEVLSAVFRKFSDELMDEYADLFFVALTAVLANDESEKCRAMAGALLQQLWSRVDSDHQVKLVSILTTWIESSSASGEALALASIIVLGVLCDVAGEATDHVITQTVAVVSPVVERNATRLHAAEEDGGMELDISHELAHHCLNTLFRAVKVALRLTKDLPLEPIVDHLLFPHNWARYDAARILTTMVTDEAVLTRLSDDEEGSDTLFDIARKSCLVLQGPVSSSKGEEYHVVDVKLADQLVKLLFNLAKIWKKEQSVKALDNPDEEDGSDEEEDGADAEATPRPLAWLMSRMSFIARRMIIGRPPPHHYSSTTHWTKPLISVLRFFAGTFEEFDAFQAKRFLLHVLSPLYRVLDDSGEISALEATSEIVDLRNFAIEVRDMIQNKVGTAAFSQAWDGVRRKVTGKREGRREDRNRMAVSDPKAWAKRQGKRVVLKKDSKKRRTKAFAQGRLSSNANRRRSKRD